MQVCIFTPNPPPAEGLPRSKAGALRERHHQHHTTLPDGSRNLADPLHPLLPPRPRLSPKPDSTGSSSSSSSNNNNNNNYSSSSRWRITRTPCGLRYAPARVHRPSGPLVCHFSDLARAVYPDRR